MLINCNQNYRHCERSEAISLLKIKHLEIAASLARLAMTTAWNLNKFHSPLIPV